MRLFPVYSDDDYCGNDSIPRVLERVDENDVEMLSNIAEVLSAGTINPDAIGLLGKLGNGISGTVYKALDQLNDRLIAVKCINLDVAVDVRRQIITELDILLKVSHF